MFSAFLTLTEKHPGHAFYRLPFPRAHLRWVQLPLGHDLLHRLVPAQRLKRHSNFKLVSQSSVASSFSHPFIRVGYILARCPNLPDHFTVRVTVFVSGFVIFLESAPTLLLVLNINSSAAHFVS